MNTKPAKTLTEAAKSDIRDTQTILSEAIASDSDLDLDSLKRSDPFPEPPPEAPTKSELPPEPKPPLDHRRWWIAPERLSKQYEREHEEWLKLKLQIEAEQIRHMENLSAWRERLQQHEKAIGAFNRSIDDLREIMATDKADPAGPKIKATSLSG